MRFIISFVMYCQRHKTKGDKCYVWLKNLKAEETLGRSVVGGKLTYERKQCMRTEVRTGWLVPLNLSRGFTFSNLGSQKVYSAKLFYSFLESPSKFRAINQHTTHLLHITLSYWFINYRVSQHYIVYSLRLKAYLN